MLFKDLPGNLKCKIADLDPAAESTAFLCEPYSLGDAVLDLSLMSELRRQQPGLKIAYITSEYIGRARFLLEQTVDRWIFLPHEDLYELCSYAVKDFQSAGPGVLSGMSALDHASPKMQDRFTHKGLLRSAITELGELPFKKAILGIGVNSKPHFSFDLTKALHKVTKRTASSTSVYLNLRTQSLLPLPKLVVEQICNYLVHML